jgi:hypothetical protein
VSNVTIVDTVTYQATATFTGLVGGLYTNGKATLTFAQFEDLPDVARYALSGGQFEAAVNYTDCSPVAKVIFPAGIGESFGSLVLNKEGSPAGKNYFWGAASKPVDVTLSCGSPPTEVTMPLDVALDGEGSYQSIDGFVGSASPPGGGSVSFEFKRQ